MDAEPVDDVSLEWEPIGTGGRARLVALRSGEVVDVEVLDLSRSRDRIAYAIRLVEAELVPRSLVDVERELLRIAVDRCGIGEPPAAPTPTLTDAFAEWEAQETVPTVCTGFQPLDALAAGELPGGLPLGTITLLLGPPATGKSAFALQAAIGALLGDPELRVLWCRGEMSSEALAARTIAVGSVLLGEDGPITVAHAKRRRPQAKAAMAGLRARIGDRLSILPPVLTPDKIENAVVASGARLVAIDYLQLVRMPEAADARTEVDGVMARLRAMSLEHRCAVLLIGNTGKAIDGNSRIGTLGKHSSQVDYDADIVLLGQPDAPDAAGLLPVKWLTKKHRHGVARDLLTTFAGDLQTFVDAEAVQPFDEFNGFAPQGGPR